MRKTFLLWWLIAASCCMGQTQTRSSVPPYVPMTPSDRLKYYRKSVFTTGVFLRTSAGSGISQLTNTPSEWGQGTAGYARRYANSYGQRLIRETLAYGASSLLDEDNRYLRSERQGIGPRLGYAIESTFMARRSDGTGRISWSRIGAVAATAFISLAWQPHSTGGVKNGFASMATEAGDEVGLNVFREFLPRRLRH